MWLFDRWSPYSYQNNREKYRDDEEKREFNLKECLWFCMTSLTPQGNFCSIYYKNMQFYYKYRTWAWVIDSDKNRVYIVQSVWCLLATQNLALFSTRWWRGAQESLWPSCSSNLVALWIYHHRFLYRQSRRFSHRIASWHAHWVSRWPVQAVQDSVRSAQWICGHDLLPAHGWHWGEILWVSYLWSLQSLSTRWTNCENMYCWSSSSFVKQIFNTALLKAFFVHSTSIKIKIYLLFPLWVCRH